MKSFPRISAFSTSPRIMYGSWRISFWKNYRSTLAVFSPFRPATCSLKSLLAAVHCRQSDRLFLVEVTGFGYAAHILPARTTKRYAHGTRLTTAR